MNRIRMMCGDCIPILKTFSDSSFDAIVTDPPFGIGFDYCVSDDVADCAEKYWKWFEPVLFEMLRVLKPGGFLAVWQAQLYFRFFWKWFGRDIHIYCAAKNFVQLRKTPINYAYDPVVMLYKPGGEVLRPQKPRRNVDFCVANTASLVSNPNRIERKHPCPRPLDHCLAIVENFVLPGGKILDPFAGSGTVGVAAKHLGCQFLGIEKEVRFYNLAIARLGVGKPRLLRRVI